MNRYLASILSLILFLGWTGSVRADAQEDQLLRSIQIEQKLDQMVPTDLMFSNEEGISVPLQSYLNQDKPVILSFVYYECPMLCTLALNGLLDSLKESKLKLGKDFSIVTVSFDPGETPELARQKKEVYLKEYGDLSAGKDWHFLTGTQESIQALTQSVGFHYAYDTESDEFAHASGLFVLTPKGKISRVLFGIQYPKRDFRLALVEASENKVGSPIDQILLFCYHYDPHNGVYNLAITRILQFAGTSTVLGMAGVILILLRREKKHEHV